MGLKISGLEMKIWEVMSPLLAAEDAVLSPTHPRSISDLKQCKAHVVLGYLNDPIEGVIISQALLQPQFSFVVYSGEYIVTRKLQEFIIDQFCDVLKAYDFNSPPDFVVTTVSKQRRSPVVFLDTGEMYSAGVDYRFFLQQCL